MLCTLQNDVAADRTTTQHCFVSQPLRFSEDGGSHKRDEGSNSRRKRFRKAGGAALASVFLLPLEADDSEPKVRLSVKEKAALLKKADQLHDDYEVRLTSGGKWLCWFSHVSQTHLILAQNRHNKPCLSLVILQPHLKCSLFLPNGFCVHKRKVSVVDAS